MFDGSPQEESLRHIFKGYDGFKREISISAVDINSGQIITFTEKNTKFEEYHHAIIASASVPGAFPPHRFHDHLLVDGMAAYNTNVQQAIDRCREKVDPRHLERITIDIVICQLADNDKHVPEINRSSAFAFDNYKRANDIKSAYRGGNVYASLKRAYPQINWRLVIEQSSKAELFDQLNFEPEYTWRL